MPELLLELFSEEIPARMQAKAADDLRRLVTDGLVAAGLTYEGAKGFVTPRRLALTVHGVTARSADIREERKGPRVGAPPQALEGFLRGAGLASIDEAQVQSDPKKGDFYVAVVTKPGRAAEDIIAELVPRVIADFPWPKSMRWGARSGPQDAASSGAGEGVAALRWVRPLRSILCTFGPETEEPVIIPIEVAGLVAGDVTYGHRFMAGPQPIRVRRFADYVPALERAKVVLDPERRRNIIEAEARSLAFAQGLELVDDPGLLDEVAGLVEWPVVLMGSFDPAFLQIPDEVIRLTIRANQKCFVLREAGPPVPPPPLATGEGDHTQHGEGGGHEGRVRPPPPPPPSPVPLPRSAGEEPGARLTNRFLLTANIEASDGGKAIVAGNERVIAARLSDARFFWEGDKAVPLEDWAKKLESVTFHEKLGTQAERVERIARLARELAPLVGADPDDADRAARLAKADLTTGMVGEFPELQGVMGRYYFLAQNGLGAVPDASKLPPEGRSRAAQPLREGVNAEGVPAPDLSSRFGREAETGTHPLDAGAHVSGTDGSRTGAGAPSGMTGGNVGGEGDARLRAIADAIRDHYKPQGPGDSVPTEPVAVAVALADKLDTLVGFWAIDEKPTGSKDPYALRRAALGVIRVVLSGKLRIPVLWIFTTMSNHWARRLQIETVTGFGFESIESQLGSVAEYRTTISKPAFDRRALPLDLLAFFADRLKVHLRETGARHDLIDAVFSAGDSRASSSPPWGEAESRQRPGEGTASPDRAAAASPAADLRAESAPPQRREEANDDLLMIVRRVEALGKFLDSEDGKNLLVGYRRAANILRAEEKKDGEGAFAGPPDAALIASRGEPEERALFLVMQAAEVQARDAVAAEDFAAAMRALAKLRPAVDAFFDKVTVNADDPDLRANRLKLLNMLRRATLTVADFSRIGG